MESRILFTKSQYLPYLSCIYHVCVISEEFYGIFIRQTKKYVKKKKGLKIDIGLCSANENAQMKIYILRPVSLYKNVNLNVIKSNDDVSTYKYAR